MYAVIKTGGKQHKVKAGDVLEVELLEGSPGDEVTFSPILVVDDDGATHFGKDLGKAVVRGKLLGEKKGDKVRIFKYRPKTGYARRQGHRQVHTLIEIADVSLGRRAARKAQKPALEEAPAAEAGPSQQGTDEATTSGLPPISEAGPAPEDPGQDAEQDSEEAEPDAEETSEERDEGATGE